MEGSLGTKVWLAVEQTFIILLVVKLKGWSLNQQVAVDVCEILNEPVFDLPPRILSLAESTARRGRVARIKWPA